MLKLKIKERKKIIMLLLTIVIAVVTLVVIFGINIFNNKNAVETMSNVEIYPEETLENNEDTILNQEESIEDIKKTEEEKEDKNLENKETKIVSSNPYYIKVNYGANTVTIYTKDENGEYTKPFKAMVCSTGTYTPTSGVYAIQYRWEWLGLYGNVYGHYVTQIVGDILFHSVPYTAMSPDTLKYAEYDKLGTSASLGCIRLKICDAKWIYDNVASQTLVEFYSDPIPGPLGKPSSQKISGNVSCRNWDPTDPNSANPWRTYKEETIQTPTQDKVEEVEDNDKLPEEPEKNEEDNSQVDIY